MTRNMAVRALSIEGVYGGESDAERVTLRDHLRRLGARRMFFHHGSTTILI